MTKPKQPTLPTPTEIRATINAPTRDVPAEPVSVRVHIRYNNGDEVEVEGPPGMMGAMVLVAELALQNMDARDAQLHETRQRMANLEIAHHLKEKD